MGVLIYLFGHCSCVVYVVGPIILSGTFVVGLGTL